MKRSRKLSPALIEESRALVRSLQEQAAVLRAWHPGSMALSIIVQQLAALAGELEHTKPEPPAIVFSAADPGQA